MPMYNFIEYSDNYSDTSGSLWKFKRDKTIGNINLTSSNSSSLNCKSNLLGNTVADGENRKKIICKNSCTTKIFNQVLEVVRNAID